MSESQFQVPREGTVTNSVWLGDPTLDESAVASRSGPCHLRRLLGISRMGRLFPEKKQKLSKQLCKCVKQVLQCWSPTKLMHFNSSCLQGELLPHSINTMAWRSLLPDRCRSFTQEGMTSALLHEASSSPSPILTALPHLR